MTTEDSNRQKSNISSSKDNLMPKKTPTQKKPAKQKRTSKSRPRGAPNPSKEVENPLSASKEPKKANEKENQREDAEVQPTQFVAEHSAARPPSLDAPVEEYEEWKRSREYKEWKRRREFNELELNARKADLQDQLDYLKAEAVADKRKEAQRDDEIYELQALLDRLAVPRTWTLMRKRHSTLVAPVWS
jgi:hypothetical protein